MDELLDIVDENGKLGDTPTALLGDSEFVGQIDIPQAKWRASFPKAEWISAGDLQNQ